MITKQDIEKAANVHAEYLDFEYSSGEDICPTIAKAFKEGIEWFKTCVLWHDADEKPRTHKFLLVNYNGINGTYGVTVLTDVKDDWKYRVKEGDITRWLYIEDLMEGGK